MPVLQVVSREGDAGFTLLELLVSITIVSLLATTALMAWRVGASGWQKANERLARDRAVLAVHQLLEEQMAAMVPYQALPPKGAKELFFQGEPQTARFVSRYSLGQRMRSGLYLVEYQVAERPGGTRLLLLNEWPVSSQEALGAWLLGTETSPQGKILRFSAFERGPQTVMLLDGLQECGFEYYRAGTPLKPGVWTEQWTAMDDELPRAMRIRAVAAAESGKLTPVSVVAAVRHFSRKRE